MRHDAVCQTHTAKGWEEEKGGGVLGGNQPLACPVLSVGALAPFKPAFGPGWPVSRCSHSGGGGGGCCACHHREGEECACHGPPSYGPSSTGDVGVVSNQELAPSSTSLVKCGE